MSAVKAATELEARLDTPRTPRAGKMVVWATAVPLALLALVAVLAPVLPIPGPTAQDLGATFQPPAWLSGGTWDHPLGTDNLGRDVAVRLLYGARLTLLICLLAVAFAAIFGTLVGLVAGYHSGRVDLVISRIVDAQLAIPFLLLAITIITTQGQTLTALVFVLAIVGWAGYARVMRSETLSIRSRPFILGLRIAGASSTRIVLRHVLPNVVGTLIVMATLEMGTVILAESSLSFLGLGVSSPDVSWGSMLAEGKPYIVNAWWMTLFPGLAITGLVLIFNFLGDGLRTMFDPRARRW